MKEIVNKFLLAEDKFIPEMQLRQPGFTYITCEPFTKNKEKIQKFKEKVIHDIFIKTSKIKFVFNMTWLLEVLKI